MLGPMLFVGVGGSGGNTVRAIREYLSRELDNMGWTGDFPDCWQTLWIDTISQYKTKADSLRSRSPADFLSLGSSAFESINGFTTMIKTMIVNQTLAQLSNRSVLAGWMPEKCPVPIA
jgi:hypothetical protein